MSYTKTNTFTAGNPILASQLETEFTNIQTGVGAVTTSGSTAAGQVLAGDGTNFISTTLIGGDNVTITPGAGTLTIDAIGGGGGGSVTSVAVSGGGTGLTTSGGPITTSGTITLGGVLGFANGGTGSVGPTRAHVLADLLPAQPAPGGYFLTSSGATTPLGVAWNAFPVTNLSQTTSASSLTVTPTSNAGGGTNVVLQNASGALAGIITAQTQTIGGAKTFSAAVTALSFNATSSARYKENVLDLSSGLDIIEQLRPVTFQWKDKTTDERTHIGFIAEETQEIIPEAVWENAEGIADSISYQQIIPVLVNAIKQLSEEIKRLKNG